MKQLFLILFVAGIFSCGPDYPEIQPGSSQALKYTDSKNLAAMYSVPSAYTPKAKWPLFIALHGYGDRAAAFHELWKRPADSLGMVLLVPEGTVPAALGYTWAPDDSISEALLRNTVDEIRRRVNIDPNRIYIGGYTAGGSYAYYMALKYSHVFSGVVALNAEFDRRWMDMPLTKERLAHWRLYIGHGEMESTLPGALTTKELFQQRGTEVQMNVYKNSGHDIPKPKNTELIRALSFLLGIN
jgi:predicted esterase